MNKAKYIFDMPECCNDCAFLDDKGDYPCCKATGISKGYNFNIRENKMAECP